LLFFVEEVVVRLEALPSVCQFLYVISEILDDELDVGLDLVHVLE